MPRASPWVSGGRAVATDGQGEDDLTTISTHGTEELTAGRSPPSGADRTGRRPAAGQAGRRDHQQHDEEEDDRDQRGQHRHHVLVDMAGQVADWRTR